MSFETLDDVRNTAVHLLEKWNLLEKGWSFNFDRSVSRFGVCSHKKKAIGLSKQIVTLNLSHNPEKIQDTILHEIAHALVRIRHGRYNEYGRKIKSHGIEWKTMCVEIGADPIRCYTSSKVKTPTGKYVYECPSCGIKITQHRKTNKKSACSVCCKKYNNNKFSEKFIFVYIGTSETKEVVSS